MVKAERKPITAVQINTEDALGGAANLTYMLHRHLRALGLNSKMLVGKKHVDDPDIFAPRPPGPLGIRLNYRVVKHTSVDDIWRPFPFHWLNREPIASADILNLHNLHGRYFNVLALPRLAARTAVCWSLHDMWAMTGLCAYSYDCERWKTGCHHCPLREVRVEGRPLMEPLPTPRDRTRFMWSLKKWVYRRTRLTVITGSRWMKRQVEASILAQAGPVVHIPDGTDLATFHPPSPEEKQAARERLGISQEANVILFYSSATPRKGVHLAVEVLNQLRMTPDPVIVSIGWADAPALKRLDQRYTLHTRDYVHDDAERNAYHAAADVFLMPTMADNLSLAMLDTLASGLPLVAFNTGGIPEAVRHLETGYLAQPMDVTDMAQGIKQLLGNASLLRQLGRNARELAEKEFSLSLQAQRYADLYRDLLQNRP